MYTYTSVYMFIPSIYESQAELKSENCILCASWTSCRSDICRARTAFCCLFSSCLRNMPIHINTFIHVIIVTSQTSVYTYLYLHLCIYRYIYMLYKYIFDYLELLSAAFFLLVCVICLHIEMYLHITDMYLSYLINVCIYIHINLYIS
jgi:hypothetical protein